MNARLPIPRTTLSTLRTDYRGLALAAAILVSALALVACADATGPLPQEGAPDELGFSIGGYGVGSRSIEVRGDTVVFSQVPWGPQDPILTSRVVPTPDAWRAFWAAADRAGVRSWRPEYIADGVADGTGWGLTIVASGLRIDSRGSNAYPDRRGRKQELESTAAFRALSSALGELVGERW